MRSGEYLLYSKRKPHFYFMNHYKRPHEEWEEPRTTATQWIVFLLFLFLAACVVNTIVDIVNFIRSLL